MNNLKRILSLALASVMVLGMMVVGASATEFKDDADIENKAAVETMTALDVIRGRDDGTFDPEGRVTRAEMATMIARALNGGKDVNYGLAKNNSFTDLTAEWYKEAIEYCVSLGIIGGYGDGTFKPDQNVTGQEAAKMMLVALGYDAEIFGFTGSKWATNVDAYAVSLTQGTEKKDDAGKGTGEWNGASLYAGIDSSARTLPLSRDQAAQLIYNGLNANTVTYTVTGVQAGAPVFTYNMHDKSLLETKFKASVTEGTMTAADYTKATSTTAAFWTYTVSGIGTVKTAQDVSDLFMQEVRVVKKGNTILSVTPASGVVSEGVVADLIPGGKSSNKYYTLDGKKIQGDKDITELNVYTFLNSSSTKLNLNTLTAYHEYRLIDNDGNGKIDCMVIIPVTVDTVRSTAADSVRLASAGKLALKGNQIAEGLTAGDYVIVKQNPETKAYTVAKAATITGTVDAVRDGQIRVDGTWYESVNATAQTTLAALLGKESNLVLVGKLLYTGEAVKEEEKASDAVMAVKVAASVTEIKGDIDSASSHYLQVRILKADSTVEVLKVAKYGAGATPTAVGNSTSVGSVATAGSLYTYTLDKQGYATLVPYAPAEGTLTLSNPAIADGIAKNGSNSFRFNEDATVFVYVAPTGSGQSAVAEKYAVLSGKDVNAWGKTSYSTTGSLYGAKAANGFTYTTLANLTMTSIPGAGADTATYYGIVTADASRIYSAADKLYYLDVDLWNGAENTNIKANGNATASAVDPSVFEKGTVVTYTVNANGTITLTAIAVGSTITTEAVEAYDGFDTIKFIGKAAGTEFDISKATISYVDTKNAAGENGTTIPLADLVDEDDVNKGYVPNVWVIWTDSNKDTVKAIIVETNNAASKTAVGEHVGTEVGTIAANAVTVTLPGDPATATALTKTESKKITGVYNDTIEGTNTPGQAPTALYTFGIFENDIKDPTSTEWYLFTVKVDEGKWKMERFNNGETTAVRTSGPITVTEQTTDDDATFAMICGNSQNVVYKLTKIGTPAEGETPAVPDVVYTFTWTK